VSEQTRSSSRAGRKLKLKARAERQEQTRRRIIQAAVELHEQVGPLATTITAIAERAGVERLTVYRHFPSEESLLTACTSHFFSQNPPPDPAEWAAIEDPSARLRRGLDELYAFWARTEPMMSSVLRDHEVDADRAGGGAVALMAQATNVLAQGWTVSGRKRSRLNAAIGHAAHFYTWRSLVRDFGLTTGSALALMADFVSCIAEAD